MTACPNCGVENPVGKRFCGDCGSALGLTCAACGAENPEEKKFCGDCGAPLAEAPAEAASAAASPPPAEAPVAERRLVSVLFADLVGFTTLSESRDAEEVRQILSRYFDTCRRLISLYGGTVEKFIGDAVMAVWGTPTATEDDAERAVRAALDLVAAVSALGDEVGAPDLRARAGVLTGEAAVTIGAEGEGMVAGDLVNTASRIQSIAPPGNVYVGDSTRRATEQTIAYEDAGSHELQGKSGLFPLWHEQPGGGEESELSGRPQPPRRVGLHGGGGGLREGPGIQPALRGGTPRIGPDLLPEHHHQLGPGDLSFREIPRIAAQGEQRGPDPAERRVLPARACPRSALHSEQRPGQKGNRTPYPR